MKEVKNGNGKLVCRIDEKTSKIEIVHKGYKTIIQFKSDGTAEVINTEVA